MDNFSVKTSNPLLKTKSHIFQSSWAAKYEAAGPGTEQ